MKIFEINVDKLFTNITKIINDCLPEDQEGLAIYLYTSHNFKYNYA